MNVGGVQTGTGAAYGTGTTQQSQDQFMQLLVTQIRNQNPLDPMSNEEFTAQLTQFSMLEQLEEMNVNMTQEMAYTQSLNNTMMLGLVGRTATVVGNGVTVVDGVPSGNRLQVSGDGRATVEVLDATGEVVASFVQEVEAGWNDLEWNGLLEDGSTAEGDYTLSVSVEDRAGNTVNHQLYAQGFVDSIRFENNLAILSVAGVEYYASEIAEVGL